MSPTAKDRVFPVLSLLAGFLLAMLLGVWLHQSQASADAQIRSQFAELEPAEQETLLNKAAAFKELQDRSPERFNRLKSIHEAVEADPQLDTRLRTLYDWWLTLDVGERNRLKKSGDEFVQNWVEEVQQVYMDTRNKPNEFNILLLRGRSTRPELFRTNEADFESFLAEVVPQDPPAELAKTLTGLDPVKDSCERTLAKIMWLQQQITSLFRDPGRSSGGVSVTVIERGVMDFLVESETRSRMENTRQQFLAQMNRFPQERPELRDKMWSAFVSMSVLRAAMDHYYQMFRIKHLGNQRASLMELFDGLDRNKQVALMHKDPSEAEEDLEKILIKQKYSENSAIAGIAEELRNQEEVRKLQSRFSSRSGFGGRGGDGRGRGERPPPGSDPRGPGEVRRPPPRDEDNRFNGRPPIRPDDRRPPDR